MKIDRAASQSSLLMQKVMPHLLKVLTFCCLLLLLFGVNWEPQLVFTAFSANRLTTTTQQPPATTRPDESLPLTHLPPVPAPSHITFTNYLEDSAIREAILSSTRQWSQARQTQHIQFTASNKLTVYTDDTHLQGLPQTCAQSEQTLLTARILMGLWVNRQHNSQFTHGGHVSICIDDILAWRGVQKHSRQAYPGTTKRVTDGYQWKHKQQVQQDIAFLTKLHVQGQHTIRQKGKYQHISVDAPYLMIREIVQAEKVTGYLIKPGAWLDNYQEHDHIFLAGVNRQLFQLNPRNDYLALRIAFYLTEHWRKQAYGEKYGEPIMMAQLLAESMISIDRANLTSRFAPRVEAALHKLYTYNILGSTPALLSRINKTQSHWGHDWLSAYWQLVPPQDIIQMYKPHKNKYTPLRTVEMTTTHG